MDSAEKVIMIVLLGISGIALLISVLQFLHIGKPLNSLYKGGNPKPYFKMSGIIFAMIAGINLLNAAAVWLENSWLTMLICPLVSVMMIYAYVTAQKLR